MAPTETEDADSADDLTSRRLRVLVADDDRKVVLSLALWLESMNCEVQVATNGRTALELAESCRPEIIFLDISMPSVDGYEVCKQIRTHGTWGEHPMIVAVTGHGRPADRKRALEAGFDLHLVKPVEPESFKIIVDQWRSWAPPPAT